MSTFTSENKSSASFTGVNKSTYGSSSIVAGNPIGLLLLLTYADAASGTGGGWQSINKS